MSYPERMEAAPKSGLLAQVSRISRQRFHCSQTSLNHHAPLQERCPEAPDHSLRLGRRHLGERLHPRTPCLLHRKPGVNRIATPTRRFKVNHFSTEEPPQPQLSLAHQGFEFPSSSSYTNSFSGQRTLVAQHVDEKTQSAQTVAQVFRKYRCAMSVRRFHRPETFGAVPQAHGRK